MPFFNITATGNIKPYGKKTVIGKTYYFDNTNGLDGNDGLSIGSAKKTITAVNSLSLITGDKVYFKRGETWKAQSLTVPSSGVTFGAYGSGANPVFDPTTRYTDYTLHSGAIWKRTSGVWTIQVFQDQARLIYKVDVASMVAGSYCIVSGVQYVWCTDSGNPNSGHVVEAYETANAIAIRLNGKSHLTFDGIDVKKSNLCAYNTDQIYNADLGGTVVADITIKNCEVSWSGIRSIVIGYDASGAVSATYPIDVTINNVTGHDDLDLSFWVGRGTRLKVQGCTTYNSGKDVAQKSYPTTGLQTHYPNAILISGNAVDCEVSGCYVHDIYSVPNGAMLDERSESLKSLRSKWFNNWIDVSTTTIPGVQIEGDNTSFYNNVIITGAGIGLKLYNIPVTPLIYHNTIISASGASNSIDLQSMPNATIKNNLLVRLGGTVGQFLTVTLAAKTGLVCDNNLYWQVAGTPKWFWGPTEYSTFANWKINSAKDAAGVYADPLFVTPNTNLHLQSGSPARNAGASGLVTSDKDGVVRVDPPDIGCYEYV